MTPLALALAIFFNRKGMSTIAGLLPLILAELGLCLNLFTTPGGISTFNLPALDLLILITLAVGTLLPYRYTPIFALFNIGLVGLLLFLLPESKELHHLVFTQPLVFVVPIFLQIAAMFISSLSSYNSVKMLKEADRADEIQTLYEEIQHLYREQERAAVTDAITGLPNHRAIMQTLRDTIFQEHTTPYSLLFIDLDHFKHINDTYGHLAGDAVLREAARRMQEIIQQTGTIGRYGGEEFIAVLPTTDLPQAHELAETIRATLVATLCHWEEEKHTPSVEISMSASIGIAASPLHGTTAKALLEAADQAMYRSKQHGRNRVSIASMDTSALPV
jgi:diguanylate cyclase (GGDEF)-like protein